MFWIFINLLFVTIHHWLSFLDTLSEAIDVAATGVGRDWDKMYLTLPFNPPRTPGTRSHDLEGKHDMSCY